MDMRQIRVFAAVAEELHFGQAAKRLHVAQSAVSMTIKTLEAELGTPLFTRTKRTVVLTPAGAAFQSHAHRLIAGLEDAKEAARKAAAGDSGRVVVAFGMMSSLTRAPRLLARLQRERPEVDVTIRFAGSAEQLVSIEQGRCDVGFMPWQKELRRPLRMHVFEKAPLAALLPLTHRLAKRRSVALRDLAHESFIFLARWSEQRIRQVFTQHCVNEGFVPRFGIEVEHLESLLSLIAAGMGVSCAPNLFSDLRHRDVAIIPLRPKLETGICAVWHPGLVSPPGRRLLEILGAE